MLTTEKSSSTFNKDTVENQFSFMDNHSQGKDSIIKQVRKRSLDTYSEETNCNKKRKENVYTKWSNAEIKTMWLGIKKNGNDWIAVQRDFEGRSRDQVKDKARRLLYEYGWTTGSGRLNIQDAGAEAKLIAEKALQELEDQETSTSTESPRKKWKHWNEFDVLKLWKGIYKHGHEWLEVQKLVDGKSYYQVKDKGRRLLNEPWLAT